MKYGVTLVDHTIGSFGLQKFLNEKGTKYIDKIELGDCAFVIVEQEDD